MPAVELQRRLAEIEATTTQKVRDSTYLRIISDSLSSAGLPDLSDPSSQRLYDDAIRNADLIVVDNLSTLCRGLKENDADTWTPMQSWALAQRRAGRTVLFVHHAGKGGNQRGTSRREDILDTVVALRRPPAWSAATGAHFQVHFEKSRGFYGEDAEPFEASLVDGLWRYSGIEAGLDDDTLEQLVSEGASLREIAERTGLSKSTVQRRLRAREQT
jgi:putative DNA primase/helicase